MEKQQPTLLVLAAGMGSRYGSLKQMDAVGPSGEAIIDYSIYDAVRAGFGRVVFVIRRSFEQEFREVFRAERFAGNIAVEYVYQELDSLPQGYALPTGRVKPWGTNHAVMMAAQTIREPFAVINADDFYGASAYRTIADYLTELGGSSGRYCMVGYRLARTLSEHGSVSRGVCSVDEQGNLVSMVERSAIRREGARIVFTDEQGAEGTLSEDTVVSMNLFGFTPDYFARSEEYFRLFLDRHISDPKAEFYIPSMVNRLIVEGSASLRVLRSEADWFGVTYKEDRAHVEAALHRLIERGEYPEKLWR